MPKKMTRQMGEALARKIAKLYGEDPQYGPVVNDTWYGPDTLIVAWEGGPFEWSYDLNGKIAEMAPKGWFVEACNGWSVTLYPI